MLLEPSTSTALSPRHSGADKADSAEAPAGADASPPATAPSCSRMAAALRRRMPCSAASGSRALARQ
jgi:hypothetical protein